ncbi:MAG TPA: ABC transporter permease subunit [Cellulomonas sp.]
MSAVATTGPAGPTNPTDPTGRTGHETGAARRVGVGNLALVELRRYAARAGIRWLVVAMILVVAMTAFGAYRSSRAPSQAQLDMAQQSYQQSLADWKLHGQEQIDSCQEAEQQAQATDPAADFRCESMAAPQPEQFLPWRESFATGASGWLEQVSTFLLLIALMVGATFVAAEFSTGSITTWLTFEPRRGRVFASKVAVAALATGAVVLVLGALAVGAFWVVTAVNHFTGDTTGELWSELGDRVGRLAAAGAAAGAIGAALAFLVRHSAAVLGVVVGWLVVVDGILASQLAMTNPGIRGWMVQTNLVAWLEGGLKQDSGATICTADASGATACTGATALVVPMTHAGLLLAVVVAVVTALALLVFRRRDVA